MRIFPGTILSLCEFVETVTGSSHIEVATEVVQLLAKARKTVDGFVEGETAVYGLNTGLGANLGHRLNREEASGFQEQIILGRACGVGEALPVMTSKAAMLARIVSAAKGYSGMSVDVFDSLVALYNAGLVAKIPRYGSIGAGDLVLNAHMALPLLGRGEVWREGEIVDAAQALAEKNLSPAVLAPKDAMALINHGCVSLAMAGLGVHEARQLLSAAKFAAALSFEGYAGNRAIFAPELQNLRPAKGQAETEKWFRTVLDESQTPARKIQDALSFRVVAPVFGVAEYAMDEAISVIEAELNGVSDSPAVLNESAEILSSPNFHNPLMVHCLDALSQAFAHCAQSMVQRVQKMMSPSLSDLPKYLSPSGGASAGMVPLQKTANSLLSEILNAARPMNFTVPPVSEAVEDMATLSMVCAGNLNAILQPFRLLIGIEALVAAQAMDLRDSPGFAVQTGKLHDLIRAQVPMLTQDRALGQDIEKCAGILTGFNDCTK